MQSSGPVPSAVSKVLRVKVTGILALNRTLACIWFIFSSPEMNREHAMQLTVIAAEAIREFEQQLRSRLEFCF